MKVNKVHLVLGSGGARGLAHIGVIDALLENGYEIISVAGCSMGAVVGGMYAAGYHAQYKDWMLTMSKSKILSLLDFTIDKQGFIKGEKIFHVLSQFINVPNIELFSIPFTAVATDLTNNKEVYFQSGNLYKALRASIAIPGIFTPVIEKNQILVDGGVLNPLPLNCVQRKEDSIIIAVDLNGVVPIIPNENKLPITENIFIRELKALLHINDENKEEQAKTKLTTQISITDLLTYSYQLTQDRITAQMVEKYKPEIFVQIPSDVCTVFDFHKAAEIIKVGKEICISQLILHTKQQALVFPQSDPKA
jgi:NTE family protein